MASSECCKELKELLEKCKLFSWLHIDFPKSHNITPKIDFSLNKSDFSFMRKYESFHINYKTLSTVREHIFYTESKPLLEPDYLLQNLINSSGTG